MPYQPQAVMLSSMTQIISFEPRLQDLLARLHAQSKAQEPEAMAYFGKRAKEGTLDWNAFDEDANRFLADKLVALEPDKAAFCYGLCRALRAKRVVEAGTSYGVSTLYLAAAVRDNGRGVVIGTEHETKKARAARQTFAVAGLSEFIDLREGDLRQTLKSVTGPIDFMLIDIWTPMARPALELVAPHLRPGAIVICDNTESYREAYRDYFAFIENPDNRFITQTLPFSGGLEMSVRVG
jgi:predicted O-methyltransferase YrrM